VYSESKGQLKKFKNCYTKEHDRIFSHGHLGGKYLANASQRAPIAGGKLFGGGGFPYLYPESM
jgi:hypothetical protein